MNLGSESVERRPELARLIGEIISQWSQADFRLSWCLAHLLEGSASHVIAMYLSLRSAQGAALRAAAESILPSDDYQLFDAALAVISRAKAERDKIAHGLWGFSDDLPNDLILLGPRYALIDYANFVEQWATKNFAKPHRTLQDEKDKLFVYKPSDFVAIKEQCAQAALIATRIAIFISESTDNRKAGRIYPMLIAEPEIQLELSRRKQNAQDNL